MKKFLLLIVLLFSVGFAFGQTSNVQVQVNNVGQGNTTQDYKINGVSKSKDIGGVDITATQVDITKSTDRNMSGVELFKAISGVTLTNYNSRAVTVILRLVYQTNEGFYAYPRRSITEERTMTVVIPSGKSPNHSKFISLPPTGENYPRDIVSVDMIVIPVQ